MATGLLKLLGRLRKKLTELEVQKSGLCLRLKRFTKKKLNEFIS